MQIGNVTVDAGQTGEGYIELAEWADGSPVRLPLKVARGSEDGPVLWVDNAVHGDELEGTVALWKVFDLLRKVELKGTIVAALIVNASAFHAMRRTSPIDDVDVNRIFPGDPEGSFTHQWAHRYKSLVETHATHYVNLHGGGNWHLVPHYAIHRSGDSDAARVSREMARVASPNIVWDSADVWLNKSLANLLMQQGIPSTIVEAGGEGKIQKHNVEAHFTSITNIMKCLGMIPGTPDVAKKHTIVGTADFFYAPMGGLWVSDRQPGDLLHKGDVVGTLYDSYGAVRSEVRSTSELGTLLGLRTYGATPSGSSLGILGIVRGE
jgi:uncharacterized protein